MGSRRLKRSRCDPHRGNGYHKRASQLGLSFARANATGEGLRGRNPAPGTTAREYPFILTRIGCGWGGRATRADALALRAAALCATVLALRAGVEPLIRFAPYRKGARVCDRSAVGSGVAGAVGIEPTTYGVRVRRSAN